MTSISPTVLGLRAEVRQLREQVAALEERRVALQAENEAAYRAAYEAMGGPRFDKAQTFGRTAVTDTDAWPTSTLVEGGAA